MGIFKTNKRIFDLGKKTYIMGILNITPDSFSDGGKYFSSEKAIKRALEIESQGADIIDIGAQSTRPNHELISCGEEWDRLSSVLKQICNTVKIPISIDTFYPEVAEKSLQLGAEIINDISGTNNTKMLQIVAEYSCGLVITHNSSDIHNIKNFFNMKLSEATQFGINSSSLCFDPGIGFQKDREQDTWIIQNIKNLKIKNSAILIGASKKRVVGYLSEVENVDERGGSTIAVDTYAQIQGANILRVHDVKEAVQSAKCIDKLLARKE